MSTPRRKGGTLPLATLAVAIPWFAWEDGGHCASSTRLCVAPARPFCSRQGFLAGRAVGQAPSCGARTWSSAPLRRGTGSEGGGASPESGTELRFFVVGDIGQPGSTRELVAKAISNVWLEDPAAWACVVCTGDNFYHAERWKGRNDADAAFACLEREMLRHVPLPWYASLGNHDLEDLCVRLQQRMHGVRGVGKLGSSWQWRCPSLHAYDATADLFAISDHHRCSWRGLIDIFVVNTNKFPMAFQASFNWDAQKAWLQNQLTCSTARWKIVVGHHPVEFVPQSLLEHTIPGLRWLTATYMTGKPIIKKLYSHSMADVIVTGGAHAYICGHQHLMAHMVRRVLPKRLCLRLTKPKTNCSYVIAGSSSKTEASPDDATPLPGRVMRKLENTRSKMSEFWWRACAGFVSVRATPAELSFEFFGVDSAGAAQLLYNYSVAH